MKRLFVMALLTASFAIAVSAQSATEYFPKGGGTICDRKDKICWDHEGMSVAITKDEFGKVAADKVMKRMEEPNFDPKVFTLRSRVYCDCNVSLCYKSKYSKVVNKLYTKTLFKFAN